MLEHNLNEHCGDASCTICAWNDLAPVKLSPKPIAISCWDHPEEWLKQYLARERSPATCTLAQTYGVQSCHHPDCQICFPPGPVTHGWEGLDDVKITSGSLWYQDRWKKVPPAKAIGGDSE